MKSSPCTPADLQSAGVSGSYFGRRRSSTMSSTSIASDVEMARNEMFSGPISESVPSSITSFSHRRFRNNSVVHSTYFPDENDPLQWPHDRSADGEGDIDEVVVDGPFPDIVRSTSTQIKIPHLRNSVEDPLLSRHESTNYYPFTQRSEGRSSQDVYILAEDMNALITGYSTTIIGTCLYMSLCVLSLGSTYLLFRWVPRWRVWLTGSPTSLCQCQWVTIEDQWKQFAIYPVFAQAYGRPLSTVFGSHQADRTAPIDEDSDPPLVSLRYIEYRHLKLIYHPDEDRFQLVGGWKDPLWQDVGDMRRGLSTEERDARAQVFGRNLINVEQKSFLQLLFDEVLHPFYIFQIASLLLWSLDEYYYYAVCILGISICSIGATIMETRSTMTRLREISHFECHVRVLRNGFWRSVPSSQLVPGDVFEISDPSLTQAPCDCLLLSGDCIINESMLTGESLPVSKVPATNEALDHLDLHTTSIHPEVAKHFLYSGTKIIRARRPQDISDEGVGLAVVARIGFLTTKGSLIRSIMFPKPSGFKFYKDSFRYISVMAMIAVLGFMASFANFIRLGLSWRSVIVRALDLITIVVPPALPATLTIGTNFAISRLRKQGIYCTSPQRINVGGKLDLVCFDKTGTLTEDCLDVLGIRVVNSQTRFTETLPDPTLLFPIPDSSNISDADYHKARNIIYTMATCHSLKIVNEKLLGDPLDIKMFMFTGWTYEECGRPNSDQFPPRHDTIMPSIARPPCAENGYNRFPGGIRPELGILRCFEFVSKLRRTSVIVKEFGDSGASVFVKGAPECVKEICLPQTLPPDFEEQLSYHTHRGYRVIACAAKYRRKMSWMKIQKMTRAEAECDLEFLGFIIFENRLKPSTISVISELTNAGIRNIMCTGDNILTAISVARECHLINSGSQCFIPRFVEGGEFEMKASLSWESLDDPNYRLDENTLLPIMATGDTDPSVPFNSFALPKYSIAVTGDVFRWMVNFGNEDVLKRMLVNTQVFARMSPDEKHELVTKLQSLDYCCGFCGDGANDCGALKAADVGISLSEAEASVAAPFTSHVFDISCFPKLIKEGRAALVTSFCCFKYMSLYSAIQFTTVSFLYASASNLGDFQFLYIDLILILPIAIFMGWTRASPILSRKRPTSDLVSRKVLAPLLGQVVICILIQFFALKTVRTQSWFEPPIIDIHDVNIRNSENTTLFLVSCYQYILSSVVLSVGPPFRQPIFTNVPLASTIIVDLLMSTYILSNPSDNAWLERLMQLTRMPVSFKLWLFTLAMCSFLLSWIGERWAFPWLVWAFEHLSVRLKPDFKRSRYQYKALLDAMQI